MSYRSLDPDQLVDRIARLRRRIEERFPGRSLAAVCADLEQLARETAERIASFDRPIVWLRATVALAIAALVLAAVATTRAIGPLDVGDVTVLELVTVLDAVFNELVLIGAATVFLVRTERRLKRRRALAALHELRSLAHVVDEHQLDKDPDRLLGGAEPTASSYRVGLSRQEVVRYLTHCTELLSSIGKLAALYGQDLDDEVAVAAVTEVEELTLGLAHTVWQKITILEAAAPGQGVSRLP